MPVAVAALAPESEAWSVTAVPVVTEILVPVLPPPERDVVVVVDAGTVTALVQVTIASFDVSVPPVALRKLTWATSVPVVALV